MNNIKYLMDDNYYKTLSVLGKSHIVSCFRVTKSTCYFNDKEDDRRLETLESRAT